MRLNSTSTGKSFIRKSLELEIICRKNTTARPLMRPIAIVPAPVSIKELSQSESDDKLGRGCDPLVGFEGNLCPLHR
jgi:hypothetical protein